METMSMIDNDWLPAIQDEFKKDYYRDLYRFVKEEYSNTVIYPPAEDIFNAFHFTPLSKVKVLLLGQDPYHNEHQAHGLSFRFCRSRRIFRRHCRTFIRNCMMTAAAISRITVI